MPITVYYHVETTNGVPCMYVTAKKYFDRHHVLDDGESPDYDAVMDAMLACGAYGLMESICELADPDDVPRIVAAMKRRGFDLQKDDAFSRAMRNLR